MCMHVVIVMQRSLRSARPDYCSNFLYLLSLAHPHSRVLCQCSGAFVLPCMSWRGACHDPTDPSLILDPVLCVAWQTKLIVLRVSHDRRYIPTHQHASIHIMHISLQFTHTCSHKTMTLITHVHICTHTHTSICCALLVPRIQPHSLPLSSAKPIPSFCSFLFGLNCSYHCGMACIVPEVVTCIRWFTHRTFATLTFDDQFVVWDLYTSSRLESVSLTGIQLQVCSCVYLCMYVCMYACMRVCVCVCVCVCE